MLNIKRFHIYSFLSSERPEKVRTKSLDFQASKQTLIPCF
ncbi:hypothetical protein SeseC_02534 [Streptococcus equi subsp. zooepidemicus ATCC 35246]|nr:hypothetical protein SeseC_02534 [Streptococcus equi subsp. zooepidemicus ATCC 35246]